MASVLSEQVLGVSVLYNRMNMFCKNNLWLLPLLHIWSFTAKVCWEDILKQWNYMIKTRQQQIVWILKCAKLLIYRTYL